MTLSKELDILVGAKGAKMSRPQLVMNLWAYIKKHNLQNSDDKRMFTPDATMAKVFGKKEIFFGKCVLSKARSKNKVICACVMPHSFGQTRRFLASTTPTARHLYSPFFL